MERRDRRSSVAFCVSAVLHGLVGVWLLTTTLRASVGEGAVQGTGTGLAVSLVSAPPSRADTSGDPTAQSAPIEQVSPADPEPQLTIFDPVDATVPTPQTSSAPPPQPQGANADVNRASSASAPSGGGEEQDTTGILAEVARCLPAGLRPRLAGSTLMLAADQEGALSAAPVVTFTGANTSQEDARTADLIVQAALQCGPYQNPSLRGRKLVLPANFGDLKASPGLQANP